MGTYILLVNSTDQGAKSVARGSQSPAGLAGYGGEARHRAQERLHDVGPYDFVQIIEAPDDEAVAKYVLSVNSKGNVRTTTMRAFDEPEHFEFLKNLP